jgi:hypothetical protein
MDPRTSRLVRMAVRNMTRVHTLRVVLGHPKLTEALLRCFFDELRQRENPVKKLWLENVRIVEGTEMVLDRHKYGLPLRLSFEGVEVVRLRRLPLKITEMDHGRATSDRSLFVYSRGGEARELQNGLGGNYLTSTHKLGSEIVGGHLQLERALKEENRTEEQNRAAKLEHWPLEVLMGAAMRFDDAIYEALPEMGVHLPSEVVAARVPSYHWRSILAYRDRWPGPVTELSADSSRLFRSLFRTDVPTAGQCAIPLFQNMSTTLTSLTIDWAIVAPDLEKMQRADYELWIKWYADLFSLRCPHLKAFQYRNAVAQKTLLPPGLYLFDHSSIFTGNDFERDWVPGSWPAPPFEMGLKPLEFFEAHANLQCLAWPMDQFFSHAPQSGIAARVRDVVFRLGQRLVDLRVDAFYSGHAEPHSDDGRAMDNTSARTYLFSLLIRAYRFTDEHAEATISRRRFINEFAAKMQVLKTIKIEGGMPLDERRETISALHRCPIEKVVLIGQGSVLGNTWGENGSAYSGTSMSESVDGLEGEDEAAIYSLGVQKPEPMKTAFEPSYGWKGRPPMLHTIASQHGSTLRELKFCGYKGAVNLYDPSPITHPMLAALKHCHGLETLIMSFWLPTLFEDGFRDDQIISYWLDGRSPTSTALIGLIDDEPDEGSWAHELRSKFAPRALAWGVVRSIGQYLSESAKKRPGGVHVRASFCVGDWGGIFDLDLRISKSGLGSDICVGYEGPREEMEEKRRREKLDTRRWF